KIILEEEVIDYELLSVDNEYYYGAIIENWHSYDGSEVYSSIEFCDEACNSEIYLMEEGELQNGVIYCLASESSSDLNNFCGSFRMFWEQVGDYVTVIYEITEEEDYKELKITDSEGNQTFYRNVAPLSVENSEFSNLKIYPNPVREIVHFDHLKVETQLRIYDLAGKEMMKDVLEENQAQVNLNFLSKGIYIYTLKSDKSVKTGKLIKI